MSDPPYAVDTADASAALTELALDLRWSYNHAADHLWQHLDPDLWALSHNPWFVLQTVSRARLAAVADTPRFRHIVGGLVACEKEEKTSTHARRSAPKPPYRSARALEPGTALDSAPTR